MRASWTGRTGKKAEEPEKYLASFALAYATLGGPNSALKPGVTSQSPMIEHHSSVLD